jgi:hypothetical protein
VPSILIISGSEGSAISFEDSRGGTSVLLEDPVEPFSLGVAVDMVVGNGGREAFADSLFGAVGG